MDRVFEFGGVVVLDGSMIAEGVHVDDVPEVTVGIAIRQRFKDGVDVFDIDHLDGRADVLFRAEVENLLCLSDSADERASQSDTAEDKGGRGKFREFHHVAHDDDFPVGFHQTDIWGEVVGDWYGIDKHIE